MNQIHIKPIHVLGLLAITFILACIPLAFQFFNSKGRVITSYRTPNDIEIYVVQRFAGEDFFNTSFYARRPDNTWAWGYADNDDFFWSARNAGVQIDTNKNRVVVLREGNPYLHYDWDDDEYFLVRYNQTTSGNLLWGKQQGPPKWWKEELAPFPMDER